MTIKVNDTDTLLLTCDYCGRTEMVPLRDETENEWIVKGRAYCSDECDAVHHGADVDGEVPRQPTI